jgi:hypothetical protein
VRANKVLFIDFTLAGRAENGKFCAAGAAHGGVFIQ